MINTYYQVPEVYYRESRDFQLLGRTYDIIFNYLKTSIDTIYHNPLDRSTDKNLLDLLACTLGFETKHNYDIDQLYAICSSFSEILKHKGTIKAIKLTLYALLNAQGIDKEPSVIIYKDRPYEINIFIPSLLVDTTLLEDVLDYIIPVGMSYNIINSINLEDTNTSSTYIKAGEDAFTQSIWLATDKGDGVHNLINYIPKYEERSDYTNLIAPGTIDNMTVTVIEESNESGE